MKINASRILLVAIVALLVTTAGCGADQTGADNETTITTTDVSSTTENPTGTSSTTESAKTNTATDQDNTSKSTKPTYPTGFSEDGFQNSTIAIKQHTQTLVTISFTSATVYDTPSTSSTIILAANPTNERVYMEVISNKTVLQEYYYENGTRYSRQRVDSSIQYSTENMTYESAIVFDGQYENLAGTNLSSPSMNEINNTPLYTYPIVDREGFNQTATSGNLTVHEGGLIPQYRIVSTVSDNRSEVQYQISKIGSTSVKKPDWVTSIQNVST